VTHDAARLQYGDGLPREPLFVILHRGLLIGARRVSGQKGQACEDADKFDPPVASHHGSGIRLANYS